MAWKTIGSLRKSKKGGLYIKVTAPVTLTAEDNLQLVDPRKSLDNAVASGRMSAEKAEEIKAKIPDYVKYDVALVQD